MGRKITDPQEIEALFRLLNRMADGYEATEEEAAELEEIYEIATPDFITFSEFLNAVSIRRELAISLCGVDQLKCLCALNLCYISVGGLSGIHFPDRIQSLNLSNTRITSLDGIQLPAGLQSLNLSGTQISNLDGIQLPTELQSLNLLGTQISSLEDIQLPAGLQSLNLSFTEISSLDGIQLPTELQSLHLSGTQITNLEDIQLPAGLRSLDLSATQITNLEDIQLPAGLQSLDLSGTQIIRLDGIQLPTRLQSLDLHFTQITNLDGIQLPTELQSLNLFGTQITRLDGIQLPAELQSLNLGHTQITRLDGIQLPAELQSLELSSTQIASLEDIQLPAGLQLLNLGHTQITRLDGVQLPAGLQSLDLSATQITSLEDVQLPHRFQSLNLSGLHLRQLLSELLSLNIPFEFRLDPPYPMHGILLEGTTLATQPISLFEQPRKLIESYYAAPKVSINEAKVIFLGDGGVGKSYTIQRIHNDGLPGNYPTETTPGIDITDFPVRQPNYNFDIHFWDFGGQEIMHAMHRCFLTSRTCYVVVICNRYQNLTGQARYWLNNVASFAKDSPVILAVNQWDNIQTRDLDYRRLQQEFPNLAKVVFYSAKDSNQKEFQVLTNAIVDQARHLDSCGMEFPVTWAGIREKLLSLAKENRNYISKDEYYQICQENKELSPEICVWLLEWFNDLGVCFSYHQNAEDKKELAEYKVLNPVWLTNAIYIIINCGPRRATNGIIHTQVILDLLQKPETSVLPGVTYTAQERNYVLEVMRKFQLSYAVSESQEFIPALCPDVTPKELHPTSWRKHVAYELQYTYLPDSVIHQLMIRFYHCLNIGKIWRKGLRIDPDPINGLMAVVDMGGGDSILRIDVYAQADTPPWPLLHQLRDDIIRINQALNLKAEDYIVVQKNRHTARFPVIYILQAREHGYSKLPFSSPSENWFEEYDIADILGTAFGPENIDAAAQILQKSENLSTTPYQPIIHVHGNFNYYANCQISNTSESAERLLRAVLDHEEKFSEQLTQELISIFQGQSADRDVQQLGAEMARAKAQKKKPLARLRDFLKNSADTAGNLQKLATILGPFVLKLVEKAPEILQFFQAALSH